MLKAIPALTIHIGKRSESKPRHIKIVMRNLNEKEMVMSNLGSEKMLWRSLKKCSVTDDYTAKEQHNKKQSHRSKEYKFAALQKQAPLNHVYEEQTSRKSSTPSSNTSMNIRASIEGSKPKIRETNVYCKVLPKEGLNFFYTNANQFANKRDVLLMCYCK